MANGDEGMEARAHQVAEAAWQRWTHHGEDVKDASHNTEIVRFIARAVTDSYLEGMDDDEWLQATMERLELERGGTST